MTTDPTPAATLAALIWEASRRDEGTISALGADIVAAHLLREVPGLGDALTANGPGAGRGTIAAPADTARPLPAYVDVVMTEGPSAEGEFVELEDPDGRSVGQDIGATWIHTASDDFWRLRIPLTTTVTDPRKTVRIPEPGTWGVVEASCVHTANRFQWVHDPDGYWRQIGGPNAPDDWDSLVDPVLVREGI